MVVPILGTTMYFLKIKKGLDLAFRRCHNCFLKKKTVQSSKKCAI